MTLTAAQHYALDWIATHGGFTPPKHPDGWRQLGVPTAHRKGFSITTLRILVEAGYLRRDGVEYRARYEATGKGRKALVEYEQANPEEMSAHWYLLRLTELLERLTQVQQAALRDALRSIYDEHAGGKLP